MPFVHPQASLDGHSEQRRPQSSLIVSTPQAVIPPPGYSTAATQTQDHRSEGRVSWFVPREPQAGPNLPNPLGHTSSPRYAQLHPSESSYIQQVKDLIERQMRILITLETDFRNSSLEKHTMATEIDRLQHVVEQRLSQVAAAERALKDLNVNYQKAYTIIKSKDIHIQNLSREIKRLQDNKRLSMNKADVKMRDVEIDGHGKSVHVKTEPREDELERERTPFASQSA